MEARTKAHSEIGPTTYTEGLTIFPTDPAAVSPDATDDSAAAAAPATVPNAPKAPKGPQKNQPAGKKK